MPQQIDAVILAGGTPTPDSPLHSYSNGRPKALIDINGRPMIEWIIAALQQSPYISQVIVVGLDDAEAQNEIEAESPVIFLPDQGHMVSNGMFSLDWLKENRPNTDFVFGCSADIPHLTADMVDWFVNACDPYIKLLYCIYALPEQYDARYPNAQRTYSKFKGNLQLGTGDVFMIPVRFRQTSEAVWQSITNARKRPWQVARVVGLSVLWKYLTRQLSLQEASDIGGRLLNGDPNSVKILHTPYVEMAMDGDKPHQIDILRQTFSPPS